VFEILTQRALSGLVLYLLQFAWPDAIYPGAFEAHSHQSRASGQVPSWAGVDVRPGGPTWLALFRGAPPSYLQRLFAARSVPQGEESKATKATMAVLLRHMRTPILPDG